MKKIWIIGVMLILLCTLAAARQTVVTKASEMKIDLLRYDPSPVQPGDTTDVWFEIANLKTEQINDFNVKLVEDYPFSAVSEKSLDFSRLSAGDKVQFKFTLGVNREATEGTYNVFIQYYSRTAGVITSEPFTITVKRTGAIVSTGIDVKESDEEVQRIAPGSVADVSVSVKNTGSSVMQDISVKLDLSSTALPFAPVGMTAEQKLKRVESGKEEIVGFKLIALPNAAEGVYKIPVIIKYYDETGQLFNSSEIVGLVVGSAPKLKIAIESTELTTKVKAGKMVLKLINFGTSDVKFATVSIAPGVEYEIISESDSYIGNIDSDDYETAEFRIKANAGKLVIPVSIEYMDANNMPYSTTQDVELTLYSPSELGVKTSYTGLYVLAIVLAIAGYFGYRRYKKKKALK